jgi:hypothetical protein
MATETLKLKCASCGAAVTGQESSCRDCGTALFDATGDRIAPLRERRDFGIGGNFTVYFTIAVALILYLYAWQFENGFDLSTKPMVIWTAVIPLWLLAMSALWKTASRITLLIGFFIGLAVFIIHFSVIFSRMNGRYLDDNLGISGMVGAAAFAGWTIGRLIHMGIRNRMNSVPA